MAVVPGSRIGVYEITSQLGEGGMGVVFRARDTKLLRDAALKVLPEHFADDRDRLARFEREAQVLASLNHPNIAQIYGLESVGGSGCIAMELVEGETLADRLVAGPLAPDDALGIAKQIVEALTAAHERGIVHRDLKPANVKITPNGVVKVLDFGLAKAFSNRAAEASASMMATQMSGVGMVVGTPAYMSPEQARGKDVDARTDIWAFGCVLYEMLTGKQAFDGETMTDVMAKVVTGQPDFALLPAGLPPGVRPLLETTLEKNAAQRLQHIGDVRLFLEPKLFAAATVSPTGVVVPGRAPRGALTMAVAALGGVLVASLVAVALLWRTAPAPPSQTLHFDLVLPGLTGNAGMLASSRDGKQVAFLAGAADGSRAAWIRQTASDKVQKIPGTDNLISLAGWSPDGRYLAFLADGKLKKVDIQSGSVQVLCDFVAPFRGLAWNSDGVILLAHANLIARVPDGGGEATPVTKLDAGRKETLHAIPSFLPDGKHFLYAIASQSADTAGFFVTSLDNPAASKRLLPLPPETNGLAYSSPGYLVYSRGAVVLAQRFDADRLTLEGQPTPIAAGVENGLFSISDTGLLFHRRQSATAATASRQLIWYDRTGRRLGQVGTAANYGNIELSPKGDRIATDIVTDRNRDIWVIDIAREVPSRITFDPASEWTPSWSPDGTRLIFGSSRGGRNHIYMKAASGAGAEELVFNSDGSEIPVSWSHDGRHVVYSKIQSKGVDTWLLQLSPEKKASPLLESPFDKIQARISPDNRWIAYATNESGMYQIVVQSFPDPIGGRWQITAQGGVEPKWRADGRELYYLALDGKLMAVPIKAERTFEAGTPAVLFETSLTVNRNQASRDRRYDVAPDGRFLVETEAASDALPVSVVVNWPAEMAKK